MADIENIENKENKIKNFKDLRIWQEIIRLVKDIYLVTRKYPNDEILWTDFPDEKECSIYTIKYCRRF